MSLIESIGKLAAMEDEMRALERRARDLDHWSFTEMIRSIRGMFERFAPWKVGDIAEIRGLPEPKESSGWYGFRQLLVDGYLGEIREVDFRDGRFVASWRPLDQMVTVWKHALPTDFQVGCQSCGGCQRRQPATFEGPVMLEPHPSPGCFGLGEQYLTRVTGESPTGREGGR